MSQEDTDVQASEQEATADLAADSATDEQINDSASNVSNETAEPKSAETGEVKEDNKTASTNQEEKVDSKPLSRRSAAYRIQQLARENKALKQQQPVAQTDEWEDPAADESQPDIQTLINDAVQKALHPVISESSKTADDGEINELFSGDKAAERTVLEPKIREMWKLDQYKDVAASDLYKIAKYDELSGSMDSVRRQAVEDYKKAVKEAKESSASGTSNNQINRTGSTDVSRMTDEEFRQHNERVKAGQA